MHHTNEITPPHIIVGHPLHFATVVMDRCPCQMVREENKPRTGPPDKKVLFAKSLREIESLRLRQRRRLMTVNKDPNRASRVPQRCIYRCPRVLHFLSKNLSNVLMSLEVFTLHGDNRSLHPFFSAFSLSADMRSKERSASATPERCKLMSTYRILVLKPCFLHASCTVGGFLYAATDRSGNGVRRFAEGALPSVDGPHRVTSDSKGVSKVSDGGGEHR